jgi:hypothetical protein
MKVLKEPPAGFEANDKSATEKSEKPASKAKTYVRPEKRTTEKTTTEETTSE